MQCKISSNDIKIGDILYITSMKVDGAIIKPRPFVVILNSNFNQLAMHEISSQNKCSEKYPYNIPILKSFRNGLNVDSHIKADQLFIYCENALGEDVIKFGELEIDLYGSQITYAAGKAIQNQDYYFYDQSNNGMKLKGWL